MEMDIIVKHKWKYYIIYNNTKDFLNNIVEGAETPDGLPLCCDFSVAISFDSPEELNEWVENNTTLSLENFEYHIEGHYETIRCDD